MKVLKVFAIIAFAALPLAANQAFEPSTAGGVGVPPDPGAPVWSGPRALLYDNGPLVTHPGGGAGGNNASAVQTALGMTIYGFGHSLASGSRVADQFTIPAGQTWDITNITFFAYQTGSSTTSTINNVNLRIWTGSPGSGTVVFGDTSTNVLGTTAWTSTYRVLDTDLTATSRPVMANTCNAVVSLGSGTYWLDWQVGGTLSSGPWAPPVTVLGQTSTGDALQSVDGGSTYSPISDVGAQGLPFVVEGTVQGGGGGGGGGGGTGGEAEPIPTLSKTGVVVLILALIAISAVLIRRRL
jgi:hypothetical protein